MGRVTLVGEALARPGAEYLFAGRCEVADRCPVAGPCQNLTLGRRYRVAAVRPVRQNVCTEHDGGVVHAVEVDELPLSANVPEAMLRGTLIRWQPVHCVIRGCPNWGGCFENGLESGREYGVREVGAPVQCPMGYRLRSVALGDAKTRRGESLKGREHADGRPYSLVAEPY